MSLLSPGDERSVSEYLMWRHDCSRPDSVANTQCGNAMPTKTQTANHMLNS